MLAAGGGGLLSAESVALMTRDRMTAQEGAATSDRAGTEIRGVSDGTRTRGIQDHNLALYQLSYAHHRCRTTARRALPGRTSRGIQKYSGPRPVARRRPRARKVPEVPARQVPEPPAPEGPRAPVPCGAAGSV